MPKTENTEENTSSAIKKYDYLDNIKWSLTVIVIVFHSAIVARTAALDNIFFNLPPVEKSMQWQYDILGQFTGICASFFMTLFFVISAYFVLPSLKRKGAARFILDKLKRLGIPVLLTIFVLAPIMLSTVGWSYTDVFTKFYAPMLKTANLAYGVTWLCWALIVFNIIFVIAQKLGFGQKSESGSIIVKCVSGDLATEFDFLKSFLQTVALQKLSKNAWPFGGQRNESEDLYSFRGRGQKTHSVSAETGSEPEFGESKLVYPAGLISVHDKIGKFISSGKTCYVEVYPTNTADSLLFNNNSPDRRWTHKAYT